MECGSWSRGPGSYRCHATGRAAFHYLPRCQPDEIRTRECHRIWKLRLFDGQAAPQIRGLIWEQECNSVFNGNRRRRSGEDRGFRGACWCPRKQFRKLSETNLLAFAVAWERGLLSISTPMFCAVPCWNTTSVESVWPSLMCGHDLGQQLPSLVLCLFQRKHRLLGWSSGRSGMVGSARISRRDPCLTDCHCQFCRAFNGMLYWMNG